MFRKPYTINRTPLITEEKVKYWIAFGLLGQICFSMRFIFQWIYSEKRKKSVIPVSFWYLSIVGSIILFIYAAIYLKDIVFTLGQMFGLFIYSRNLALIYRHKEVST